MGGAGRSQTAAAGGVAAYAAKIAAKGGNLSATARRISHVRPERSERAAGEMREGFGAALLSVGRIGFAKISGILCFPEGRQPIETFLCGK